MEVYTECGMLSSIVNRLRNNKIAEPCFSAKLNLIVLSSSAFTQNSGWLLNTIHICTYTTLIA